MRKKSIEEQIKLVLKLCLILVCSVSLAQRNNCQHISAADGLSQGMIYDITQDSDGFIWVATKNGLNRFDGNRFKIFYPNATKPYAVPTGQVIRLFQDSKDRIWLGTKNAGIHLYIPQLQRFYEVVSSATLMDLDIHCKVYKIHEDLEGHIWVGFGQGQVIKIVPTAALDKIDSSTSHDLTSKVKLESVLPYQLKDNCVFDFIYEPNGKTIIIRRFDMAVISDSVTHVSFQRPRDFSEKNLFVTSSISQIGSKRYLLTNNGKYEYTIDPKKGLIIIERSTIKEDNIFKVDEFGIVWAFDENRICSTELENLDNIYNEANLKVEIASQANLTCVFNDRAGNVWIGTNGRGIFKIDKKKGLTENYFHGKSSWQVNQDSKGRLYSWQFDELYTHDGTSEKRLWDEYALGTLFEASDSSFWRLDKVRGRGNLVRLSHLNQKLQRLKSYEIQGLYDPTRLTMLEDRQGLINIVAGNVQKLIIFDPAEEKFELHDYSKLFNLPVVLEINYFYEDVNNHLWICFNSALVEAIPEEDSYRFKKHFEDPEFKKKLSSNIITCAVDWPADNQKYLLLGTRDGGMIILNKITGDFEVKTEDDGLPSNGILGIIPTSPDSLWLSTFQGISIYSFKQKKSVTFNTKDGLSSDEFNTGVFKKGLNGDLIFGSINGVSILNPSNMKVKKRKNQIKLVDLKINNRLIKPQDETGILSKSIESLPFLKLMHNQNNVSFEFSELNFIDTKFSSLQYRLIGVNEDWIEAGSNRTATFVLLPPGKYNFELRSTFDENNENTPLILSFEIYPAWYASWYAYLFYFIILGSLLYLFNRYRQNQYFLKQELAFNAKEKERLAELDQMKSAFLTNISHELKTPLTLISGPFNILQKKYPKERLFGMLNNNVGRLQDLILQLLDIQKVREGKQKLFIEKLDVAAYVRLTVLSFRALAETRNIDLNYIENTESCIGFTDKDKLHKIITNFISNALKFTPEGGEVTVKSSFVQSKKILAFSVQDNGIGLRKEELPYIFDRFYQVSGNEDQGTGIGLALVKELVFLFKGEVSVDSKKGKGSTFNLELPLNKESWDKFEINEVETLKPAVRKEEAIQIIHKEKPILLLVEDNTEMQDYLTILLSEQYEIIKASNGKEGVQAAKKTIPDLILTDLMMPEMDGFEFSRQIKETNESSHVPIVMLTAKNSKETKLKGYAIGLDYFLNKPFDNDELKGVLGTVFTNRKKLQIAFQKSIFTDKALKSEKVDVFGMNLKKYLNENYQNSDLSLTEMAAHFNLSKKQFARKVKSQSGTSPMEFLRKYRLKKAAVLIEDGGQTISEIAFTVGYENLSYFSRSFRAEFGVSPSEYSK